MPLTFTVDWAFLLETAAGWLVLAGFTLVWGWQYWQGKGTISRLLAIKNFTLCNLFLHMALSALWVALAGDGVSTYWAFQNYRRISIGVVILAYILLQIEIYRHERN